MKITIERNDNYTETQVDVRCSTVADSVTEELIHKIQNFSTVLNVTKGGSVHKLFLEDIYYAESVDDRTFLYTASDTFETQLKLYQLEEQLTQTDFVRISKSVILNTNQLEYVKTLLNTKIEATLLNGEKLLINRHYVAAFKEKFGV